jgi:hypothetical protein
VEIPSFTPDRKRVSSTLLLYWEPVSPRILSAGFQSKSRKVTILHCHATTNVAGLEDK